MSRITRQRWLSSARGILDKAWTKRRSSRDQSPLTRLLRIEPLEDRRLLAITVNTLVDEADGSIVDGDISLRDAIAASPAGGTINFSVTGTINLALGQVNVQNRILEGPGAAQLTIKANINNPSSVFTTRGTTTISGMTITGGNVSGVSYGGGIRHEIFGGDGGHLTVRDCVITGNTAYKGGGIHSAGYVGNLPYVTVVNSTISNNRALGFDDPNTVQGGGIYASLTALTVDKSTISGNTAADVLNRNGRGGGIYGNLTTVTNSTISGNNAYLGAGFYGIGLIYNSTISGNAHDGLYLRGGAVANSTITGNFPGIRTIGGITLTNSIVAGNSGADIAGPLNVAASRNNLIGSDKLFDPLGPVPPIGPPAGGLTNGVNGNLVDFAEPGLGPLANNGGPTQTHALWSFSPAINAGDNSLVPINPSTGLPFTTDQTGAPRIFNGGTVDMGAVELQGTPVPSTVVNTATDDVAANSLTSLREAVGFARTLGVVVTFDPTVFATLQTIALVHGQVQVDGAAVPVTIAGPGASLATVDAGGASRVFKTVGTTTISGLTITGGAREEHGGIVDGAIYNEKGTLTVQNSLITGNETNGIVNLGALTVSNSSISDNMASSLSGGGILSFIVGNNADDSSLFATISDSIIDGNVVEPGTSGGGIFANGTLTISNSTISGNSGRSKGGGIYHSSANGTLTISNSTISGNSASEGGGIIHIGTSFPTIINSTISGNSAGNNGGGIHGSALLINSTISGNSARIGGGMWAFGAIVNSTIANNTATDQGGGLFSAGSTIILNSIVAGNRLNGTPSDVHNSLNPASAYSLIGDAATAGGLMNGVNGNIVGVNPLLGSLAVNEGGSTETHALLAGSPAIDAGDPGFIPGGGFLGLAPIYDQRGFPFSRVIDGNGTGPPRIDIGAFEVHLLPPAEPPLFGDYNQNGVVDAADYVVWRKALGTTGLAAFAGADGDGNGVIDQSDYNVWRAHFGQSLPAAAAGASYAMSQMAAAATSVEVATHVLNEVGTAVPTTTDAGSDTPSSIAEPVVGSALVSFARAEGSPRVPARRDAAATWGSADALPHDNGLLAWLSSRQFAQSPLAEEIGSSWHSNEDATQSDCSEANSVDEIFAGLVSARPFDF